MTRPPTGAAEEAARKWMRECVGYEAGASNTNVASLAALLRDYAAQEIEALATEGDAADMPPIFVDGLAARAAALRSDAGGRTSEEG